MLTWLAITSLEAWLTTCEDYDGWGVFRHLRLCTDTGSQWHYSDKDPYLLEDLTQALLYYLNVEIDWLAGSIKNEYQHRRQRWHRGWLSGRCKPVVYRRAA